MVIGACAHQTPPPAPPPVEQPTASLPDTAGAVAFLEEMAAVARAALLRQPLPAGSLAFRPEAGGQLVALDPVEQAPPAGTVRRLFVFADTVLAFAGGGCLRMTVLVGTTGFRVGTAKFVKSCETLPNPPALAPLTASLTSIAATLAGRGGHVPWFSVVDLVSCVGEESLCEPNMHQPDEAALAGLRDWLSHAGAPIGVGISELGPIEIGDDRRAFYVGIEASHDLASIRRIKVKQVRAR